MSKKLKTTILISSIVLVVFIVGLLGVSMIGNISAVEVFDFRVMEKPGEAVDVDDKTQTYEIYLAAQKDKNLIDLSQTYPKTTTVSYEFKSANEDVAVVELNSNKTAYQIYGKSIGVAEIGVTKITKLTTESEEVRESLDKFRCIVYRELSTCDIYLTAPEKNFKEFVIQSSATNSNFDVKFASSNPNVATVYIDDDGRYYINAKSVGKATITAYCAGNTSVNDKFIVNVYSNPANNLEFVDKNGNKINSATIYDDGTYYNVYYKLTSANNEENVNAGNVEIYDYSKTAINIENWPNDDPLAHPEPFDTESGVIIDVNNNCLKIKKSSAGQLNPNENHQALGFVSLAITPDLLNDEIKDIQVYTIPINIIHIKKVGVEFEVSNSPVFSDKIKNVYNSYSDIAWKRISVEKNDEEAIYEEVTEELEIKSVNDLYFNSNVKTIYVLPWTVYNNGDRELIMSRSTSADDGALVLNSPDSTYFVISVTNPNANSVSCDFDEETITISKISNVKTELYQQENEIYTFSYWDYRMRDKNEITNNEGVVTGFKSS